MKHIRMYEEYRYFKSPIGNIVNYKDTDEPFLMTKKQAYWRERDERRE